jgi:hypothetical protein
VGQENAFHFQVYARWKLINIQVCGAGTTGKFRPAIKKHIARASNIAEEEFT